MKETGNMLKDENETKKGRNKNKKCRSIIHYTSYLRTQTTATAWTRLSTSRCTTLTLACTCPRTSLRPEHLSRRSLIHTLSHRGSSRPARVTPSMHGHLRIVFSLRLSSTFSFSPLSCLSSSRPSWSPCPLSSARCSPPKTCATPARGPWAVMLTRHPAQVMSPTRSWTTSTRTSLTSRPPATSMGRSPSTTPPATTLISTMTSWQSTWPKQSIAQGNLLQKWVR